MEPSLQDSLWSERTKSFATGRSGSPVDKLRAWYAKGAQSEESPWLTEYQGRELEFIRDVLGDKHPQGDKASLFEFQREAVERLFEHRFLSIRGPRKIGKSHLIGRLASAFFFTAPSRILILAPRLAQNKDVAWASIHETIQKSKTPLPGTHNTTRIELGPKYYITAATARDESATRGYHSGIYVPADPDADELTAEDMIEKEAEDVDRLLVILDEAQAKEMEPAHKALDGLTGGGNVFIWKFGNTYPLGLDDDHGFVRANRSGSRYFRIHVSWREEDRELDEMGSDAFFTPPGYRKNDEEVKTWLGQMSNDYGEDSALYLSDVCGRFTEGTHEDLCVTRSMLKGALIGTPPVEIGPRMGIDLGFVSDPCVASLFLDGVKIARHEWLPSADDLEAQVTIATEIAWLAREWGIMVHQKYPDKWDHQAITGERISIDDSGLVGVCSNLASNGIYVDRVNFAANPDGHHADLNGEHDFVNVRAEMYWSARRLLQEGRAQIPEKYEGSWQQAQWTRFERVYKGGKVAIKMEPKEDVKKRHGRSPDDWDADVLAMRETIAGGTLIGGRRGKSGKGKRNSRKRSKSRRR